MFVSVFVCVFVCFSSRRAGKEEGAGFNQNGNSDLKKKKKKRWRGLKNSDGAVWGGGRERRASSVVAAVCTW